MAISEKTIGEITIDNEIVLEANSYCVAYINTQYKGVNFLIHIPREVVVLEFERRGKARGVVSYYHGDDETEHELTFDEWEENVDYRDEFDAFVQTLAAGLEDWTKKTRCFLRSP